MPAVPIYIGETIDPLALIGELRAASESRRSEQQLEFFRPYTDLTFEEKIDCYQLHPRELSRELTTTQTA